MRKPSKMRTFSVQSASDIFPIKLNLNLALAFQTSNFNYCEDLFLDEEKDCSEIYFYLFQIVKDLAREHQITNID